MESSVEELIAAPVLVTFRADGESWTRTRLGPAPDADQNQTRTRLGPEPDWGQNQTGASRDHGPDLSSVAGFNFSSSGREDVDVRTLGNGQAGSWILDLSEPRL